MIGRAFHLQIAALSSYSVRTWIALGSSPPARFGVGPSKAFSCGLYRVPERYEMWQCRRKSVRRLEWASLGPGQKHSISITLANYSKKVLILKKKVDMMYLIDLYRPKHDRDTFRWRRICRKCSSFCLKMYQLQLHYYWDESKCDILNPSEFKTNFLEVRYLFSRGPAWAFLAPSGKE